MRRVLDKTTKCLFVAIIAAQLMVACSNGSGLPPPSFATGSEVDRVYRLNVGDKFKMTVFGEPDLSGTYEVNALGQVSLPLVGEVAAKGRSVAAFRRVVRTRYAGGFLKNPTITIDVTNYRPIYVQGEVKSGGEFAFKNGLRIRDVIAKAGGYTYRADQSFVVIVRGDYPAARLSLPSSIEVLPGDNIKVEERFF